MDRIYLDNAATTAVSQPVMEAMLPYYMHPAQLLIVVVLPAPLWPMKP